MLVALAKPRIDDRPMYSIQWSNVDARILKAAGLQSFEGLESDNSMGTNLRGFLAALGPWGNDEPGAQFDALEYPFGPKSSLLFHFVYYLFISSDHAPGSCVVGGAPTLNPKSAHVEMLRAGNHPEEHHRAYLTVGWAFDHANEEPPVLTVFPLIDRRLLDERPGWSVMDCRTAIHQAVERVVETVNVLAVARAHLVSTAAGFHGSEWN